MSEKPPNQRLLEACAKAAGLLDSGKWDEEADCILYPLKSHLTDRHHWDPRRDDGDALRLLNHLNLSIERFPARTGVPGKETARIGRITTWRWLDDKNPDAHDAMREAICLVAADLSVFMRARR